MAAVAYVGFSVKNGLMACGIIFTALLSHSAYTQIRNGLRYRRYGRKIDNAEN